MTTFAILRLLSRIVSILYFLISIFLFLLCIFLFYLSLVVGFADEDIRQGAAESLERDLGVSGEGVLWTVLACFLVFLALGASSAYASVELFRATAKDIPEEKAIRKALFFRNVAIVAQILEGFCTIFMLQDFFNYRAEFIKFAIFFLSIFIVGWYVRKLEESPKGPEEAFKQKP